MKTLAIDIGGTKFTLAVFDGESLVLRESRATDREGGRDWMLYEIRSIAGKWKRETGFERCGIGFGGPVNFAAQVVALSTHVGGWKDFPLTRWVEENLDVPAVMDNDANVGALGEAIYGAGKGLGPAVFYMTVSTGIGGDVVIDGHIYRGSDSYAGEIGHLTVRPGGPECLCGAYGCLERMCGGLWLEKDYGRPAKELLEDPDFVRGYVVNLALTDSLPTMTAYANDVSFDAVFIEQLKNFAQSGDVVLGISASGNSPNVLRAIEYANSIGCKTIGLTGRNGGKLAPLVGLNIQVPVAHMGRIEDGI